MSDTSNLRVYINKSARDSKKPLLNTIIRIVNPLGRQIVNEAADKTFWLPVFPHSEEICVMDEDQANANVLTSVGLKRFALTIFGQDEQTTVLFIGNGWRQTEEYCRISLEETNVDAIVILCRLLNRCETAVGISCQKVFRSRLDWDSVL